MGKLLFLLFLSVPIIEASQKRTIAEHLRQQKTEREKDTPFVSFKDKNDLARENDPANKRCFKYSISPEKQSFLLSTTAFLTGIAALCHGESQGQNRYNMTTAALSFGVMVKPEGAMGLFGKIKENVYNCSSYLKTQISKASCCTSKQRKKR